MSVVNRLLPYALCDMIRNELVISDSGRTAGDLAVWHHSADSPEEHPKVFSGMLPSGKDDPQNAIGIILPSGTDGLVPLSTYNVQILVRHERVTPDGNKGKRICAWYAKQLYKELHKTTIRKTDLDIGDDELFCGWVFMVANHPPGVYYWDSRNLVVFSLNFTCRGVGSEYENPSPS